MSRPQTSDVRRMLESAANEYQEARQAAKDAAQKLDEQRGELEKALGQYYTAVTGYKLLIRSRGGESG